MVDRNAEVPQGKRITSRIGVNLGDVIIDGDDIYGDGVNIAARLEVLAEPGGICISRAVRNQIRDKLPYTFEDMGERSVKNIARPVRVDAMSAAAVAGLPQVALPEQPLSLPRGIAARLFGLIGGRGVAGCRDIAEFLFGYRHRRSWQARGRPVDSAASVVRRLAVCQPVE
jgi:adenylate cyclase